MAVNYLGVRAVKKLIREVFFNLPFYESYKRYFGYEKITCYNSDFDFTFVIKQNKSGDIWIHLSICDVDFNIDSFVFHLYPDRTFFYPDNYDSLLTRIKSLI